MILENFVEATATPLGAILIRDRKKVNQIILNQYEDTHVEMLMICNVNYGVTIITVVLSYAIIQHNTFTCTKYFK